MSSMLRYVVTGGTDGMGRAVALDRLAAGHRVAIVGRDPAKGAAVLAEATRLGARDRAHLLVADLALVRETRRVAAEVRALFDRLDGLVLCARHYRSARRLTAEGLESTFALFYLSRYVLGHELADLLDAADRPIVVNVAGPDPEPVPIRWDDPGLAHGYHGLAAQQQGGQLNDLLGVDTAGRGRRARYVLVNPGTVRTGFSGEYDAATAAQVAALKAGGRPVADGIRPILAALDAPPAAALSASVVGRPLAVTGARFDPADARRLAAETERLLAGLPRYPVSGVSPTALRAVLDGPVFATVATLQPDGSAQQSVVWVRPDGDDVLFVVGSGSRKERNLRRDPRVSVLVSPPEAPYGYAAIRGTAILDPDAGPRLRDELALKYIGTTYAEHIAATPEADHGQAPVAVRVRPERVAGRL